MNGYTPIKVVAAILMMLVITAPVGYTQLNIFQMSLAKKDPEEIKILEQSEMMKDKFSNKLPILDFDIEKAEEDIINPFESRLPHKDEPEPVIKKDDEPIAPINDEDIPPPSVSISGLVWNTERPQAIVNNDVVNIGDTLDTWVIVDITREGILIESPSKTRQILKP